MFNFGSPEDQAQVYIEAALGISGPTLPECPVNEMSLEEQRNAITYLYIALSAALREGADADVVSILEEQYKEAFQVRAAGDEDFRKAAAQGQGRPPGPATRERVNLYKRLAREA